MINHRKYELKLIAGNRGIKNYQNMAKEELLNAIVKSQRITENLSKNGLDRIARMRNLSLDKLEQITEMNNLSENKLKQIAKTIPIKSYKDMLKEDLLIALLKSNQSHTEFQKCKDNNSEIRESKKSLMNLEIIFQKKK